MFIELTTVAIEPSLLVKPVPHVRELEPSEFDSGLKLVERNDIIPWQLALKREEQETKELSPQEQAYKALDIDVKEIPRSRILTEDEADAFNIMDRLLGGKDKLIGVDGKFTKGDIPAIQASLQWYERVFAGKQLNEDPDLLAGKLDNAARTISSKELLLFKAARDTLVKYAERIGHKPKGKRYVPQDQASLRVFVRALLLCKDIPKSVKSRPLEMNN